MKKWIPENDNAIAVVKCLSWIDIFVRVHNEREWDRSCQHENVLSIGFIYQKYLTSTRKFSQLTLFICGLLIINNL